MTRIGLISDTHNYLDEAVFRHFDKCDEIWHGGDFGSAAIVDRLKAFRPLRGVYGNIDGQDIRAEFPLRLRFKVEGVNVLMQHIGGYPNKYAPGIRQEIISMPTQLFISGHSHILKVIYDEKLGCLHMNPGAAGSSGWHQVRTIIRFEIEGAEIRNCQVIELGKRGLIASQQG